MFKKDGQPQGNDGQPQGGAPTRCTGKRLPIRVKKIVFDSIDKICYYSQ